MTWMKWREVRERYRCFAKQLPFKLNFSTVRLLCHHCTNCHCNATHIIRFLCTNWRAVELLQVYLQLYNTTHCRGCLVVVLGVLGIGSLIPLPCTFLCYKWNYKQFLHVWEKKIWSGKSSLNCLSLTTRLLVAAAILMQCILAKDILPNF